MYEKTLSACVAVCSGFYVRSIRLIRSPFLIDLGAKSCLGFFLLVMCLLSLSGDYAGFHCPCRNIEGGV